MLRETALSAVLMCKFSVKLTQKFPVFLSFRYYFENFMASIIVGKKNVYISVAFGLNIWYPSQTLKRGAGQPVQKLKIRSGWVVWP